jgi:hypothetical protein
MVLKTMITRALRISTPHVLKNKKSHLTKALVANGYSIAQINTTFCLALHHKSKSFPPPSPSPPLTLVSLPYIQCITNHISKLLAKKNIKTLFKPYKTLKQLLKSDKDKFDPMLGQGVY